MVNLMHTSFPRQLENEILDGLAPDDPDAIQSRSDLQRINRIMGSAGILADALMRSRVTPKRIIELGAGDGSMMLRLANKFHSRWPDVHLTMLDRQELVSERTRDAFADLGWSAEIESLDVMDWAMQPDIDTWDICVANLFIHHFDRPQISTLFEAIHRRTSLFIACEPRRGYLPLLASRLVGVVGANGVTRKDAVLSVQAGFCGRELSPLWPHPSSEWQLDETPAGLFSHRFIAARRAA